MIEYWSVILLSQAFEQESVERVLREMVRESVGELVSEVLQGVLTLGSCHLLVILEVVHSSIMAASQDMCLIVVGGPLIHALNTVL